jgi:hypothetical protein
MTEEYKPFGEEWEKELMKHSKKSLIQLYKNACLKNKDSIPVNCGVRQKIAEDVVYTEWGGAYEGRENIKITTNKKNQTIKITGFYDGQVDLEVEIEMPINEFMERLKIEC